MLPRQPFPRLPAPLPQPHPMGGLVSTPGNLPANLRFGPTQPGIQTRSGYTGATVGGGNPLNMVHPQPATFQAPVYSPISMPTGATTHAIAPILAALATTLPGPRPEPPQIPPGPLQPTIAAGAPAPPPYGPVNTSNFVPLPGAASPNNALSALIATLAQSGQKVGSNTYRGMRM